jgi:hypothetical protein
MVRLTFLTWLDKKAMETYRVAGVEANPDTQGSPEEALR